VLGEGSDKALASSAVSTDTNYVQLSTNAASGAIVNMKSNATGCGGMLRTSDTSACDIGPAASGIAAGQALFGVKLAAAGNAPNATTTPSGTLQPAGTSSYNTSTYFMDYVSGDATGVTSAYGSPILDTDGAPVDNKDMQMTFGASISNNTPAGTYKASLNLIATGKY